MTHPQPASSADEPPLDRINLRVWFVGYLGWLGLLTAAALWGLGAVEQTGSSTGWAIWIFALYAFYLSLCCTFFPLPTSWFVLLAASDMVAEQTGMVGSGAARLVIVATLGAVSTGMANLNEYHVLTYLLRFRRVARLRKTRVYRSAAAWFATNPFWAIVMFSFIPISVDVVRWLAITYRYSRGRFFAAYVVGRWVRYAILATSAIWLSLSGWQIIAIQAVLACVVLARILMSFFRRLKKDRDCHDTPSKDAPSVVGDMGTA